MGMMGNIGSVATNLYYLSIGFVTFYQKVIGQ